MAPEKELSIEELYGKFPAALEYLKEIFLINRDYGRVQNSVIAKRLGVSKPAVTQAMNRLRKYNLIEQDLYGSINLKPRGRMAAVRILKRHYLVEHLLIGRLDYPWVKSDEEASRIQASLSDEFTEYLYELFNHPETCPHGNPFPDTPREREILGAPRLIAAQAGERGRLVRITEEGEAAEGLLQFCYENRLQPGQYLVVREGGEDKAVLAQTEGSGEIAIPEKYARYICYYPEGPDISPSFIDRGNPAPYNSPEGREA